MPEYVHPDVYIEEIERGPRPIEGVPTSTAAFLGETERGPIRPGLVTSYIDYKRWFGVTFKDARYLPHVVRGFFDNGGKRLYTCRIVGENVTTASRVFGDFIVRAVGPGLGPTRVGQDSRWIHKRLTGQHRFPLKSRLLGVNPKGFCRTIRSTRSTGANCHVRSRPKILTIFS